MAVFCGYTSTARLFEKRLVIREAGQHDMPMAYIRFKKRPFLFCPFLRNDYDECLKTVTGYCLLHPSHKPLVCSMAPAGREMDFETESVTYLITPASDECPVILNHADEYIRTVKTLFNEELGYELRYFRIMERLRFLREEGKRAAMRLYLFDVRKGIGEHIEEFERLYM
ncbi:MAG: hypothetical protein JW881_22055 [Spirochaetales bacterium]|nr:hypothetical protein [Spirochaetales bacterium]